MVYSVCPTIFVTLPSVIRDLGLTGEKAYACTRTVYT